MLQAILVTIAYSVKPEKLNEYLSLMSGLVGRINGQAGIQFSLYAVDGQKNSYVEVYSCDTMEAYDALEDNLDESSREAIAKIAAEFVTNRQTFTSMHKAL
jgi:hypothetical protein